MSQAAPNMDSGPVVPIKAQPNVYTVLLIILAAMLLVSIILVAWKLTGAMPRGYGLPFKALFSPLTATPA